MTDQIIIRQLEINAIIGIHEWEKQKTQTLFFDLDLSFDCRPAAISDDIKDALDYFEVCARVTEFVQNSRYELIETLAEQVAALVLKQFACEKIKLTLYKPEAIKNTQTVGVNIIRRAKKNNDLAKK